MNGLIARKLGRIQAAPKNVLIKKKCTMKTIRHRHRTKVSIIPTGSRSRRTNPYYYMLLLETLTVSAESKTTPSKAAEYIA